MAILGQLKKGPYHLGAGMWDCGIHLENLAPGRPGVLHHGMALLNGYATVLSFSVSDGPELQNGMAILRFSAMVGSDGYVAIAISYKSIEN